MNDLIRREDAIEVAYQLRRKPNDDEWDWWLRSFNAIPSADRPSATEIMNAYHEGVRKGIAEAYEASRPKGEWELECDGEGECDNLYRCPFCGNRVGCEAYDKPKFCDECGADLRGEQNG